MKFIQKGKNSDKNIYAPMLLCSVDTYNKKQILKIKEQHLNSTQKNIQQFILKKIPFMSQQHSYQKEPFSSTTGTFSSGDSSYNARSGLHSFSNIKWGEIPNGDYTISSTSNTGNIQRFNLTPNQDIGSRSNLQIHQKTQNPVKDYFGWDTKGCISVDKDAMSNIKVGDTLRVGTRQPSFSNSRDVMNSIVQHNGVFETIDYDPRDYFNDVPDNRSTGGKDQGCTIF